MNSRIPHVLLVAFTLATFAAGRPLALPQAKWETSNIKLCWQSSSLRAAREVRGWSLSNISASVPTPGFQNHFRSWIEKAYNIDRVGIGFSGFEECPIDEEALKNYPVYLVGDMRLLTRTESALSGDIFKGISTLGDQNKYRPKHWVESIRIQPDKKFYEKIPYKSGVGFDFKAADELVFWKFAYLVYDIENALGLNPNSKEANPARTRIFETIKEEIMFQVIDSRKFLSLHEFGHLLGLLHEDRRHDASRLRPDFCKNIAGDDDKENNGTFLSDESRMSTEYDPFSIMSYCRDTMQILYRKARIVCKLESEFDENTKKSIAPFLKNCPEILALEFPVDLTKRDITALRQIYLNEPPRSGEWLDFHKSEKETRLLELIKSAASLPFGN